MIQCNVANSHINEVGIDIRQRIKPVNFRNKHPKAAGSGGVPLVGQYPNSNLAINIYRRTENSHSDGTMPKYL